MSSFPDDLRESFRREAVADPARIPEIAARLAAEERKRSSRFGDPKLDALYRKLGSHGAEAQSEFQQVVELLKGEVDPEQVFDQIVGRRDRQSGKREVASVVQLIETPQAMEQRRRRAEEIAGEIENLTAAESLRIRIAADEADRAATEAATTVPTVAVPATPQLPQRMLAVASLSVRPPHWAAAAAAASVVVAVMSCVGFGADGPADRRGRPGTSSCRGRRAAASDAAGSDSERGRHADCRNRDERRPSSSSQPRPPLRREEETRLAKVGRRQGSSRGGAPSWRRPRLASPRSKPSSARRPRAVRRRKRSRLASTSPTGITSGCRSP